MKFVFGLLLGFALGVLAGLLLAPQSGDATLAQLSEQGVTLFNRTSTLGDELKARATEAVTQGRQIYDRTKDELTQRYNQTRSQF
ncbi:MAG TPA: YtxH domain-containing protein [Ktedonobacteraceae bacterium]|nr:YtxH domain-containing protein [Ktedonobacteraceae bacterium]